VGDRITNQGLDLYRVLGVATDADLNELRRAYRRRLRQLHPDTRQAVDDGGAQAANQYRLGLARVLDAYQVLRDPVRRARYDAERSARSGRRNHPPSGGAGSGSRTGGLSHAAHNRPTDAGVVIKIGPLRIDLGIGRGAD
jgi:curved DNA-binding protein CbpA